MCFLYDTFANMLAASYFVTPALQSDGKMQLEKHGLSSENHPQWNRHSF
jgi:hypothetical protein